MRTFPTLTPHAEKWGTRPPRPPLIDAMLCLCRISQSNILAKKFVITQMGMLHKVQKSAASVVGDQYQAGDGFSPGNTNFII